MHHHLGNLTFASFLDENKTDLEKETNCQINLLVFQGRLNSVAIEGQREAIDPAIESIERRLLDCLPTWGEKKLLMHDIAVENFSYYRHSQGLVYQREPDALRYQCIWQWMCVENIPENIPKGFFSFLKFGFPDIVGTTGCRVYIFFRTMGRRKSFLYISGNEWLAVRHCRDRARDRICRAIHKLRTTADAQGRVNLSLAKQR
jgi:hypothetical protein